MRWIARIWGAVATVIFAAMALQDGIPRSLDWEYWEVPVQLSLLAIVALGGILAWRWQALGASVITIGAVCIGALASIQYTTSTAMLFTLILYFPALLFWLDWQRTKSLSAIVLLAVVMALVIGGGVYTSHEIYADYRGPTHPQSSLVAQPVTLVEWVWSGAMTHDSAVVKASLTREIDDAYLVVSDSADLAAPARHGPLATQRAGNFHLLTIPVEGLRANTQYYYAIEVDGERDLTRLGRFRTFADEPFSFTFALGSCARTGSNGSVFDTIREHDPLFFLATGDLFYENIGENDPNVFRDAYGKVLSSPAQSALYRSTPIVYVWDDHDYGPNNSDRTSPSKDATQRVHRELVPDYPMAVEGEAGPIYHAFTVGRVRFIVTDNRSEKSPKSDPDNAEKTVLGTEQKEWFKSELLAANGRYPVIVWVQSFPWIATPTPGADHWAGYTTERTELADFIADNQIQGLMVVAGDAHMIAADDGTNSDYSSSRAGGFPVFQAAPLDRRSSVKGGPYSEGAYRGSGQFGLITITDEGGANITVTFSGRNYLDEEIVTYSFAVPADSES